jgi:anti-anti-sigma regulatory factor
VDGAFIMDDYRTWEFPRQIGIEKVCEYEEHLKKIKKDDVVIFDLRNTMKVHSSFIGFLIHAKHHIRKNGGRLILFISLAIERILIMLNIIDHFSSEIAASVKKTA